MQANPLGIGDTAMIGKVQFVSATEGWISGSRGSFLHTTNAGENWTVVEPFPDDTLWSPSDQAQGVMSWVNQTHGWKINSIGPAFGVSYGVVIHKTTNGGNTWEKKILSTTSGDFGNAIQFVDENHGWVLIFNFSTWGATFLRTIDGGENWTPFTGAGIFYFVDANNGWSYYGSGQGFDPPFKILRTTDGGDSWNEQFTDNTKYAYNAMHFSDLNNGWVVGDSGKVLKTADGGVNWNFVTNTGVNPNNRSKAVYFLNSNVGWISSKSTLPSNIPFIQHTTDGGVTWKTQYPPIDDPNGGNAIFNIFFFDENNGWLTADWGRICRYSGTTDVNDKSASLSDYKLNQNYPNPFNPSTKISWQSPASSWQTLKVFDVLGNEVATIIDEYKPAGSYEVNFNAKQLASGVYYYQFKSNDFIEVKKLILMK